RVILYGLTTSGGMIGLIVALVGGVLIGVIGLLFGASGTFSFVTGVIGAVLAFVAIVAAGAGYLPRQSAALPVLFPTPTPDPPVTDV
ncbi:MAG: hypothetical protein ACT4OQ_10415, partial [Chloroflexota bacterium]